MSVRAVIIGLALAVAIATVGYYNDSVLNMTDLVGNHFPISVFGLLALMAILFNPLLHLLGRRLPLRPRELAVIVALALVACSIPGSGLMRTFLSTVALPAHFTNNRPGWRDQELLEYAPDRMLFADGEYKEEWISRFMTGAKAEGEGFGLSGVFDTENVPWGEWAAALSTWLPLIVLTAVCVICLSLIVHSQWAYRERLRYPIALVASTMMAREPGRALGGIYRNRVFWLGLGAVFCLHVVNGLASLYPDKMIQIPLQFDFTQITQTWPKLGSAPKSSYLFKPQIYLTVVAFAFFLAADVSFSLGISHILFVLVGAALYVANVPIRESYMINDTQNYQLFGSYLGIGILLLYMGRRYYWDVLRGALTTRRKGDTGAGAVWACRILIVTMVVMTVILKALGLDLLMSLLVVFLILLMFLVMGRINAETGMFFIQPYWQPVGILIGLFGMAALGPNIVIIVALICTVLTVDPRESLMPFILNGLKMCDDKKLRPPRIAWASGAAYVLALAAAVIFVFWASYNLGGPKKDGWAFSSVPRLPLETTSKVVTDLEEKQQLEVAEGYNSWDRITNLNPKPEFLWAAGIGLALVAAAGLLRLRFTWWPLHPVLFLVWGTYPIAHFSHSFLLGWFIKAGVTHFGGGRAHRKFAPLMVGVIAGDLLGGLLWMIHGAIHYARVEQLLDKPYMVFPA
ncbi:MAG: hypothetical protein KGY99_00955 [Phycisphaerae bacterium]|nr:hypothetical protein [Phycisphaerae bacterium]